MKPKTLFIISIGAIVALVMQGCGTLLNPANRSPSCSSKSATIQGGSAVNIIEGLCTDIEDDDAVSNLSSAMAKTSANNLTETELALLSGATDIWGVVNKSAVWTVTDSKDYVALQDGYQTFTPNVEYRSGSAGANSLTSAEAYYLRDARHKLYLKVKSSCVGTDPFTVTYTYRDYRGADATGTVTLTCSDCVKAASCSSSTACTRDSDCASGLYCNTSSSQCVACVEDRNCSSGKYCKTSSNECVACTSDTHCSSGYTCSSNSCVATSQQGAQGGQQQVQLTVNFTLTAKPSHMTAPSDNCSGDSTCTVTGSDYPPNDVLTFQGSVSGGKEPYTYKWDLDTDKDSDDAEFVNGTVSRNFSGFPYTPDTINLRLRVTDADGNATTKTKGVRVTF